MQYQGWIVWEALSVPVRMIMPAHYSLILFAKGEPRPLPGLVRGEFTQSERDALSPQAEWYCLRASCMRRRGHYALRDRAPLSDIWSDIHRLKHNSRRVDHPCQLPPTLLRRQIALFTYPDEVVLDLFNGAGTTTLTAQQMGRRYIGVEISEQYHQLALMRHQQLQTNQDPFEKKRTIPKSKNSRVERLPKQRYLVSKKRLQLDVKRISLEIGHLPTRDEVKDRSPYPIEYFDNYFVSWGEVCAAARNSGMSDVRSLTLELPFDSLP